MLGGVRRGLTRRLAGNRVLLWVCLVIAVNQLGFGIIVPVTPIYARTFGVSEAAIGLVVAIYGLGRFLFSAQLDMRAQVANLRIDALLGKPAELDTVLDLLATLTATPPSPRRRGGRYHPRWTGGDPFEWWVWDTWEGCPADLPPSLSRTTALDIAHTLDQRQTARDQRRWLQHEIVAPK